MGTDIHEDHGDDDGDDIGPSAAASRPVFFFDIDNCVSKIQESFSVKSHARLISDFLLLVSRSFCLLF